MLQSYTAGQPVLYDERERSSPGLAHYLAVAKRRFFYFLVPLVLIFGVGSLLVVIQRSIYSAEGKILVETQEIPADLVRPTVTDTANQRIQVIQQRIMTRDNLLAVVNKFNLFTAERQWMSSTQLLDLMKERTQLKLVELNRPTQQNNLTLALTLGFEYEDPTNAMKVANEFLTMILSEDARTRTNRASETTKFLAREVKRLEDEIAAVDKRISELRKQPRTNSPYDQLSSQLATLKSDLLQKSAQYSDSHPEVKALKRKIAALEQLIAKTPQAAAADLGLYETAKQRTILEKNLEEANHKLTAARLGESLERDQQSERLQVIEQPTVPQKPVRPDRAKLIAMVFALAAVGGIGAVFAAEALDKTIRSGRELFGIVDSHLVVIIPYITTGAEAVRKKRKLMWLLVGLVLVLAAGVAAVWYFGMASNWSIWFEGAWMDSLRLWISRLTRLTK